MTPNSVLQPSEAKTAGGWFCAYPPCFKCRQAPPPVRDLASDLAAALATKVPSDDEETTSFDGNADLKPRRADGRHACVNRLALQNLAHWSRVYRAHRFRHHQQTAGLTGLAWRGWLRELRAAQRAEWEKAQRASARRSFVVARSVFECWLHILQRGREVKVLAPVLADCLQDALDGHHLRKKYLSWRRWCGFLLQCRAADDQELLLLSFRCWQQSSVEQRHKRGVLLLCQRYSSVRLKRKSLFAWRGRLQRLTQVSESVLHWAARLATALAHKVQLAWHDTARRRRSSRQAEQELSLRRRSRLVGSWRLLLLRKVTAMGVAEAVLLNRALRWMRAWQQWAFAHARRRERDEVKLAIVRESRKRWWVERWCSAGRFQRLVDVAQRWDGQVLCRQLVRKAFLAWSAVMGLYACAEKAKKLPLPERPPRLLLGAALPLLRPCAFTAGAGRRSVARRAEGGTAVMPTEDEATELLRKKKEQTLEAIQKAAEQDAPVGEDLGKFWVNQPGQLSFEVQFNRGDQVKDLRKVIEKVTGIPPEAQELRGNGELMYKDGQMLEAVDLSDIWVMDDRDDSPERGEWNPDPEEDMDLLANPFKIGVYIFAIVLSIFWVTQVAGVNPYGKWPEGPRLDWSQVPEDLRPGGNPIQMPQSLSVGADAQEKMLKDRKKSQI
ncbi:unnamed protein product [Effrenium voratum]|uniref:Ubiquitin-like domain-containing protein n=1 Tax=Effrenium voratum TaxID=2562239 RepID=A0AA36JAG2_9DINO|nr:unnamed protein product [Effrenium voratum]